MKKLIFIFFILVSTVFSAEFVNIKLHDYIKIISKQKNISIVIDDKIDSNYSIFISSNAPETVYYDILKTILKQNKLTLKFKNTHFFITKKKIKETKSTQKVRSYKFNYINEKDIIDLMSIYTYKFKYIQNLKTIFIDCTNKEYSNILKIFSKVDKLPKQKKLKITILDTNLTKLKDYGFNHNWNIKENVNNSFFFNLLAYPFSTTNIISNVEKSNFTTFIKFMNSKDFTNILSSPTISIFDNKKSLFEVVKNIPYKTGETTTDKDLTKTTTAISYKDIGLKVEILPIINENQTFLDLTLTIENILDTTDTPTTSKRHFKQYVSLKDDELFILNGINQTEKFKYNYDTPILSDLPYLGWLFKNRKEDIKSSNLTILLELIDINQTIILNKEAKKIKQQLNKNELLHKQRLKEYFGL